MFINLMILRICKDASVEKIKKQIDWEPKLRTDAILKSIHESLI